jgi:hypothetical protein
MVIFGGMNRFFGSRISVSAGITASGANTPIGATRPLIIIAAAMPGEVPVPNSSSFQHHYGPIFHPERSFLMSPKA